MIHITHESETKEARQVQLDAGVTFPSILVGWCGAREQSVLYFTNIEHAAMAALTEDRTLKRTNGVCAACLHAVLTALIALPVAPEPKP